MKKYGLTILAISICSFAMAQEVDDIIKNYCKARGEDKFVNVQSYQMEGLRVRNDVMPAFIFHTRPNKYMMKFDLGDLTAYRVYDGKTGWYTAPWRGVVNPEELPADATEVLANTADFGDQLANWKEKGHKLSLLGDEQLEGKEHFVIELESSTTGLTSSYYIDKETYLHTKTKMVRLRGEQNVTLEIFYSDYRSVDGIMFPFIVEEYSNGNRAITTEYDEIILNPDLPDNFYDMSLYKVN